MDMTFMQLARRGTRFGNATIKYVGLAWG